MKGIAKEVNHRLTYQYDDELIWIEGYGKNSLRVRVTRNGIMPIKPWAFDELDMHDQDVEININDEQAMIRHGDITCIIDRFSVLHFYNQDGQRILEEQWQTKQDLHKHQAMLYFGRELKPMLGGMYQAQVTFEPNEGEQIYGMGQRQMKHLDMMGCELELAQRNSQASIPFYLSNKGYGFFWNNPGHGRVNFSKNLYRFTSDATELIDYWITVGDSPANIMENYTTVVGKASEFPEWASGFWQCKLRYKTQEEVLSVARRYVEEKIPISVIVIDFFHWEYQGDWSFDKRYFPDPKGMVDELKQLGIQLVVSVWPTVDPRSENYAQMKQEGLLVQTERGVRTQHICQGATVYYDTTNPKAREYVWEKCRDNYYNYGIQSFWLDEAEPEYSVYDFDNYRYYAGTNLETGSIYPREFSKGFYEGMKEVGINAPLNLVRCAWAGSQKYGALLWSGDIHSSFESLRMQLVGGLNAALSGIAWWTTDIGGFYGGDPETESFRELVIRWFQFGLFCPVMRLHGYRLPIQHGSAGVDTGVFDYNLSGDNEVWSFGEDAKTIIVQLIEIRETLREYIHKSMERATKTGTPIMRPVFYDYYEDREAWKCHDTYMFGSDIVVAPILYEGQLVRDIYLPKGQQWFDVLNNRTIEGGQQLQYNTMMERIPVFVRTESIQAFESFIKMYQHI